MTRHDVQADPQQCPSAPHKHCYRYVACIVLGLLLCIALALGIFVKRVLDQNQAVDRIKHLGGMVGYDYQYHGGTMFDRSTSPPGPEVLRRLLGDDAFAHVEVVIFANDATATDADLEVLEELPGLRALQFGGGQD